MCLVADDDQLDMHLERVLSRHRQMTERGLGGSVWNHTGGQWTEYAVAPEGRLRALWGYAHDEVYVAGSNGSLYRFDGQAWTRILVFGDPRYAFDIRDIWGPKPGSFIKDNLKLITTSWTKERI